jgi:hypothetical protein
LEEDAGLDPCTADSDGDGCSDPAEYYLGGCDDPRNAVIAPRCFSSEASAEASFVMPQSDHVWNDIRLQVERVVTPFEVRAIEATPSRSAAVSGDGFGQVQSGATLRFRISLLRLVPMMELQRGVIEVIADGQPLASGALMILPLPVCPILI